MSEFQRFVSYINLYEENRKVRSLGFAKIENRGGQCKIEIHMRGTGFTGISCPAYLFVRKERKMEGVFLGKIPIQNGTGEGCFRMDGGNINGSGYRLEQIGGFLIFVNDKVMFASQWDEQEIRREWFALPEEEPLDSGREEKQQEENTSRQGSRSGQGNPPAQGVLRQNTQNKRNVQPLQSAANPAAGQPVMSDSAAAELPVMSDSAAGQPVMSKSAAGQPVMSKSAAAASSAPSGSPAAESPSAAEPEAESKAPSSAQVPQPAAGSASTASSLEAEGRAKEPGITATEAAAAQRILPTMMQKAASSAVLVQKAASSAASQRNGQPTGGQRNSRSAGGQRNSQFSAVRKPSGDDGKNRSSASAGKNGAAAEEQEQPWEQKWKFLLENYPVLTPFEGEEKILCIRMELRDIRVLPKRYWYLGNNSFLLHGFFNYRYLVFGMEESEEGKRWFIGVPGVFQSQEKVMASIFGFPEYKSEKKSGQKTGRFGYWYRYLEM